MLKQDYQKLFDSISPDAALEQRTEREIIEMLQPKVRRSLRRTVCIAVAAAILVIGAAFAAMSASGILDLLFLYSEPSLVARESVIRDAASVSEAGVTVNMDEYLFDHNTLHLGWTVSSERENPVYYTTAYDIIYATPEDEAIALESVGGLYGSSSSEEVGDGILVRLSEEHSAYSGHASYAHNAPLTSPVTAHVTIRAYETGCEEVSLPIDFIWDLVEDEKLNKELEENGRIGVTLNNKTNIQSYAAFREALERLSASGMEWNAANEAALTESGIFKEVAVLELTVPVDPGLAPEIRFALDCENTFELSDATVILKTLDIDMASTLLEYEVITHKEFNYEGAAGNGVTYLLFDQNGNCLNADISLSMSCGQVNDRDGKHVFLVSASGNPIPETVTAITFVPTAQIQRGEESSNAYFQRMKEAADESQCFTIVLN